MTPAEPFIAMTPVAEALEALSVPYYIAGSIASVHYGVPRSTVDIDLVADLRDEHVDPLVARLNEDYYADRSTMREAIRTRGSFNLIHLPTMFKVDIFIPRAEPFHASSRSRAIYGQPIDADRAYPIATAEDTILSKLRWYREGGETSERQWLDVLGILQVQDHNLDRDYLLQWARELGIHDLLDRAWREATKR